MFAVTSNSTSVTAASYAQHRQYVLSVLRRRCGWLDRHDCEAILHDAYVVFLEKQRDGVLGPMNDAQIRAYLTHTALHKALDERKSARRRLSVPLEDATPAGGLAADELPVEERIVAQAESARLRQVVSSLPERRRRVLSLRLFLDQTPEEIQRQLGISQRVYRRELERGKRALSERACAA
jgi:RNA polymerase sigma factor (sigma-70 family)